MYPSGGVMETHEGRIGRTPLVERWGELDRSVSEELLALPLPLLAGKRRLLLDGVLNPSPSVRRILDLVGRLSQPNFRFFPSPQEAEQAVGRAENQR